MKTRRKKPFMKVLRLMKIRHFCFFALLATVLVWPPCRAHAQFSFTFTPASVTGAPGGADLTFFGTLTNTGTTTLTSGQDPSFNLLMGPSGVDLTTFPVFLSSFSTPDTLAPGTTAVIPIFSVSIDPAAPIGVYSGNILFSYGGHAAGQDVIVNVAPTQAVPEAGSLPVLGLGLVYLAGVFLRRRLSVRV